MSSSNFKQQVSFLLDILPIALNDNRLALKGGTAINLFVNNMPRLSVDIDLTYLPIEDRVTTLANISLIFNSMVKDLNRQNMKTSLKQTSDGVAKQIIVMRDRIVVKIEINLVIRGSCFEPVNYQLCGVAQNEFKKFIEVKSLPIEDLYGGKFCASLDRGHPRDLYDLMVFFKKFKINKKIKDAFIFYLLSSNRPMAELLDPGELKDFNYLFNNEFKGMVNETITIKNLLETRDMLVKQLNASFTDQDKEFLISFKKGNPKWELNNDAPHLQNMPSVKWKLHNIQNMTEIRRIEAVNKLRKVLNF